MKTLQALFRAMSPFVRRHPYFSLLAPIWLVLAALVLYQSFAEQMSERNAAIAEGQPRYELEAEAQKIHAQAARIEAQAVKAQCHIKSVCKGYGAARRQCAGAGDLQHCLELRMGNDVTETVNCTNDGDVAGSEPQPGWFDCLLH